MSHSHVHSPQLAGGLPRERSPEEIARQRRAQRIMMVILIPITVFTIASLILTWPTPSQVRESVNPQATQFAATGFQFEKGTITEVKPFSCDGQSGSTPGGAPQQCGQAQVRLTGGPEKGQTVQVNIDPAVYASGTAPGQEVVLSRVDGGQGGEASYQFVDFSRGMPMFVILLIGLLVIVAVARWRGLRAIVGLAFAAFVLVEYLFPALVTGANPIFAGLTASTAIMIAVLYLAHGFSARTTTALMGTLFGMYLAAALGFVATKFTHLTGVSGDEDAMLTSAAPELSLVSVVTCGIIIAGLGVLNDVTITQASAVWELAEADPDGGRLFTRAMRIGRDHIASTIYTIAFATTGAGLGTYILIALYDRPLLEVVTSDMFASELVRTLVGTMALVLAVPLTTAIGVAVVSATRRTRSLTPVGGGGDELVDVGTTGPAAAPAPEAYRRPGPPTETDEPAPRPRRAAD